MQIFYESNNRLDPSFLLRTILQNCCLTFLLIRSQLRRDYIGKEK